MGFRDLVPGEFISIYNCAHKQLTKKQTYKLGSKVLFLFSFFFLSILETLNFETKALSVIFLLLKLKNDWGLPGNQSGSSVIKQRRLLEISQEGEEVGLLLIKRIFAVGLSIIMLMRLLGGGDF